MDFNRTGIILYTINYQKCVKFYQDILELNVLFKTETLTCFEFGSAYLMVEIRMKIRWNLVKIDEHERA